MKRASRVLVLMLLIPAMGAGVLAGCGKKGPPLPPLPPRQAPAKKQDSGVILKRPAARVQMVVLERGLKRGADRTPWSLIKKKRS